MNDTDEMASKFADSIKPNSDLSFDTNVSIYAMHSMSGAMRWGKNTHQNVCPVFGELYITILEDDVEDGQGKVNKFAPQLENTYKDLDLSRRRVELLLEVANDLVADQTGAAQDWLLEAKKKIKLKEGLLEDRHVNAVFRGNQYIFAVYALVEALKALGSTPKLWAALQRAIDLK